MIKNLRSLIQENFPLDLRVQIELLSRRRDIVNEEKHQELIKLLQSFDIKVVPLGPGTNRYAFRLNGFVVKVATDHDGKIDNFKEFKMAKRLHPYVTKIYEVSENGTLLVAEYIQPFGSYTEMYNHADEIRDILSKLSTVYLIGDVGITAKNFANWGLRIGSNSPVCLDFAYVYEVSSELFICRNCKTNSMLVPNRDFTELYCPNKACNKHYRFEEIRARIGNDIHNHEIGDLSQEGYKLSSSGLPIELDDSRSNYLARRKGKEDVVKEVKQEPTEEDPSEMEFPPSYYIEHNKEEKDMSIFENSKLAAAELEGNGEAKFKFSNGKVIRAVARTIEPGEENIIPVKSYALDKDEWDEWFDDKNDRPQRPDALYPSVDPHTHLPEHEDENDNGEVAFECRMDQVPPTFKPDIIVPAEPKIIEHSVTKTTPVTNNSMREVTPVVIHKPQDPVVYTDVVDTQQQPRLFPNINDHFINAGHNSFSKLANCIGYHMHEIALHDAVKPSLRDRKMSQEQFYRLVQNAVFRSLGIFCHFKEVDVPNRRNPGTHKEFDLPDKITGMPYEPTMIFVARFWNNNNINGVEKASDIMIAYRDCFPDYQGIQREWLPLLEARLKQKINMDGLGIKKIVDVIAEHWCVIEEEEDIPDEPTPYHDEEEEDIAFSTSDESMDIHVAQSPVESSNEDEYVSDENPEEQIPTSVEIFYDDTFDIVKVNSGDAFGPISIPFYTKLDKIDISPDTDVPSIADNRNGVWDWLIHLVPDMMFRTNDPNKWLEVNEYVQEINHTHIVIMDENKGECVMGIYYLSGIFIVDDEGVSHPVTDPDILAKINKLIRDDIGYGSISHHRRSLSLGSEMIHSEEYVSKFVRYEDDDENVFDDDGSDSKPGNDPEEVPEDSELEDAAIRSIMGDTGIEDFSIVQEEPVVETAPQEIQPVKEEPVEEPVKTQQQQVSPNTTTSSKEVAPGVFTPVRRDGM